MSQWFHIMCRMISMMLIVVIELRLMPVDRMDRKSARWEWAALCCLCFLIVFLQEWQRPCQMEDPIWQCLIHNFIWANLLLAVLQDARVCRVYRMIWVLVAALLLVECVFVRTDPFALLAVLFYGVFQECICCSFYGAADCHCYVCLAFVRLSEGISADRLLPFCIQHMMLSFLILGIISICEGNINSKGNLVRPVPFIPYIFASYCILWYL